MVAAATIVFLTPTDQRRHAAAPLTKSHVRRVSLAHIHNTDTDTDAESVSEDHPLVHKLGKQYKRATAGSDVGTAARAATNKSSDAATDEVCLVNRVWAGSDDFTIVAFNATTGEFTQQFTGHSNSVRCLGIFGTKLFSGSDDGTLKVWDVATLTDGACIATLTDHHSPVVALEVVSPAFGHAYVCAVDMAMPQSPQLLTFPRVLPLMGVLVRVQRRGKIR